MSSTCSMNLDFSVLWIFADLIVSAKDPLDSCSRQIPPCPQAGDEILFFVATEQVINSAVRTPTRYGFCNFYVAIPTSK